MCRNLHSLSMAPRGSIQHVDRASGPLYTVSVHDAWSHATLPGNSTLAAQPRNLVRRALRQMDRSFWCLHSHLSPIAILGLPLLMVVIVIAFAAAAAVRTWDIEPGIAIPLFGVLAPAVCLMIVTFLPLPCAVFAWFAAEGDPQSPVACFEWCRRHSGRLAYVAVLSFFAFLTWFLFLGIPMLIFWSRNCFAPFVALFETHRRIYRRSKQLLYEGQAVQVLAGLYLLLTLALVTLIFIPRLVLASGILKTPSTVLVLEYLWVFELTCGVILLCGVSISWCIALALYYHDLRKHREGDWLRNKIQALDSKYVLPAGMVPTP